MKREVFVQVKFVNYVAVGILERLAMLMAGALRGENDLAIVSFYARAGDGPVLTDADFAAGKSFSDYAPMTVIEVVCYEESEAVVRAAMQPLVCRHCDGAPEPEPHLRSVP